MSLCFQITHKAPDLEICTQTACVCQCMSENMLAEHALLRLLYICIGHIFFFTSQRALVLTSWDCYDCKISSASVRSVGLCRLYKALSKWQQHRKKLSWCEICGGHRLTSALWSFALHGVHCTAESYIRIRSDGWSIQTATTADKLAGL